MLFECPMRLWQLWVGFVPEERIKGYRNFGTKLWNAARFRRIALSYSAPSLGQTPDVAAIKERSTNGS